MKDLMIELIEKFKKNSKLSIADKEIYEKELATELSKGEYSDDLETILFEGPVETSMKVLAQYLAHIEFNAANAFVNKFIHSKRIEENKGGTSGMRIVFLYNSLWSASLEQNKVIEKIFIAMIRFSYKNGKEETNKKTVDLIRKNVIPLFADDNKILTLQFVNQEKTWINLRNLFVEAAVEGELVNSEIVQKVFYWLKSANKDMGKVTEDYLMNRVLERNTVQKSKEKDDSTQTDKQETQITTTEPIDGKKEKKEISVIKNISASVPQKPQSASGEFFDSLVSVVLATSKELVLVKSEISMMKQKSDEQQSQINRMLNKQVQQEDTIHSLASEKIVLQKQNTEFISKISELEQLVEKQKKEIDERKQFTNTVTRNREKQSEEQLNKLASKLRVDYRDFCDAKEIDMTIDLGENMREQLGAVFSILEKSGIKLS